MENGNSYPGIRIDKLDSDTVVRFIDQGNDAVVISGTLNMGSHRIIKGADPVDGKDFATKDYVDQISGLVEGSDVDSVNNLTGSLTFVGADGISISDNDVDTITITGPDLSSFATIAELNSVSGTLQSQIDGLTFDMSSVQQDVSDLQSDVSSLGSELVTISGHLQSQIDAIVVDEADVSSLNSLQGDLIIQGAGSVSVSTNGSNIVVSGTVSSSSQEKNIHIVDRKTGNTHGGTFTASAYRTRDLNTILNDETGQVSLSSNQFILPAGTYTIVAHAPAINVDSHKTRLWNATTATEVLVGSSAYNPGGLTNLMTTSAVQGLFTSAAGDHFEIQHRSQSTTTTTGFGRSYAGAGNDGVDIYTQVWLRKIA